MTANQRQFEELQGKHRELGRLLQIEESRKLLEKLDADMAQPDFWQDQERARAISQEAADLRGEIEAWEVLGEELRDAYEIARTAEEEGDQGMLEELEKNRVTLGERIEALELKTFFSEKYDHGNAIISLHAGAGGTDAQDWTEMLLRMFARFAERMGWDMVMLDESRGEEAGVKSASFALRGRNAYGYMKSEAGVHRLVRISPFDAEKMRHTSFALVEVIPELDKMSEEQIEIDPKDLRIDTYLASGHGGQGVNTTYSAVRVTHLPTNTVVTCQNERSQQQNKETALRVLKSRLFTLLQEERAEKIEELKGGHKAPEWGNQIRSYVLHPYQQVKDHRTGYETQDVEAVLNGELVPFMEAYLRQSVEGK